MLPPGCIGASFSGPLATRLIGREPLITFVTLGELTKWAEIAACCLTHEVPLATLNLKDYQDFSEHHGLRLLS